MCSMEWARCFVVACIPPSFTEENNMLLSKIIVMNMLNYAIESKQNNHVYLNQAVGHRQLTV